MDEIILRRTLGKDITQQQLVDCAKLFSENYGVWSNVAQDHFKFLSPAIGVFRWLICITGSRIKMSTVKLQSECLPSRENTILVTCITSGTLVGHAFATTWDYGEGRLPPSTFFPTSQAYPIHVGTVCWITQLVVRKDQRDRGIATFLLKQVRSPEHTAFGLVSSHPVACLALCRLGS